MMRDRVAATVYVEATSADGSGDKQEGGEVVDGAQMVWWTRAAEKIATTTKVGLSVDAFWMWVAELRRNEQNG